MKRIVITAAKRTAIGNFNGQLAGVPAHKLGAACIKALLEATGIKPEKIDEVILGQVLTAGCGQNPARQASLEAGIGIETPVLSINKLCGSGMKAVHLAYQAICTDEADIVIAGGQENMSLAPHILSGTRHGVKLGDWTLKDTLMADGLSCAFNGYSMGITAENIVDKFGITRDEQDQFAVSSQQKASAAQKAGKFAEEICPIVLPQRKGDPLTVAEDEFIRHDATVEGMAKLRPAFKKDGSVTAGNASGINDGAAALMLMSEETANKLGLKPLAVIKALGIAGVDPSIMGTGPIPATRNCLKKAGWQVSDLDLIESNEAFAAQAISVNRDLKWNLEKVNVNGGAIALGHPIGASGARILTTLLHEMIRRDAKKGLATMCIGGGQGIATALERA